MNTQTTLSVTDARKQLFKIINEVSKQKSYYTITEKGKPKVVILSSEEFDSWREAMEIKMTFSDIKKDIKETNDDIKTGKYKTYKTIEEIVTESGYLISDKKNKYDISDTFPSKSGKRNKENSKKRK